MIRPIDRLMIETYKKEAEELGLTLQEYLTYLVLDQLNDLKVTTYPAE